MKRLSLLAVMLFAAGCHSDLENASSNMRKGDAFFATKEYDAAEYYYEKIPAESPWFAQAHAKLDSIAAFRRYWSKTAASPEDMKMITLGDHSASMMNAKMKPLHSFVITNNTDRTLRSVTVEFTYYDIDQRCVGTLTCDVDAPVPPKKNGVFNRVEPGTLTHTFYKSKARLVGAEF